MEWKSVGMMKFPINMESHSKFHGSKPQTKLHMDYGQNPAGLLSTSSFPSLFAQSLTPPHLVWPGKIHHQNQPVVSYQLVDVDPPADAAQLSSTSSSFGAISDTKVTHVHWFLDGYRYPIYKWSDGICHHPIMSVGIIILPSKWSFHLEVYYVTMCSDIPE